MRTKLPANLSFFQDWVDQFGLPDEDSTFRNLHELATPEELTELSNLAMSVLGGEPISYLDFISAIDAVEDADLRARTRSLFLAIMPKLG